jgi:hypothetical protein
MAGMGGKQTVCARYIRHRLSALEAALNYSGWGVAMDISIAILVAVSGTASPWKAPSDPLAREVAVWRAVKSKRMDVFAASMTTDFVGSYAWGVHGRTEEIRVVQNQTLRSFKLGNFRAQIVDRDNVLVTYTADVRGTEDRKSFSGRYWNTSLWHRTGDNWLTAFHGEAKAK